jgi:hypothetical protein
MEKRINWLHISDLHYGQTSQNILLPRLKKELFSDLQRLNSEIGTVDIVFFTGDLTYSGRKDEFDELTIFLDELWRLFKSLGSDPYLIAIPGNHDLLRPDPKDPVVKVLRRYNEDEETRSEFWNDIKQGNEHYKLINCCFDNFTSWYKNVTYPKPDIAEGIIPGDIATSVTIDGLTLKLIGLNTAFLEFANGDYRGKLAIHPFQLMALTHNDPLKWIEEADITLLLTHHDNTWYDKESLNFYNGEINPPGSFFSHLCGHLHEPSLKDYGQIGTLNRQIQLAPSLFGLEKINDSESRIHGYFAGAYIVTDNQIIEKLYPRTSYVQHGGGNYRIAEDHGFDLNMKNHIEVKHVKKENKNEDSKFHDRDLEDENNIVQQEGKILQTNENIFDLDAKKSDRGLEQVPRVLYPKLPQHANIRLIEQNLFVQSLSKDHYCWIITDWSLSEDGFIGSTLERMVIDNKNNFLINLDGVTTDTELLDAFKEQSGMALTNFCNLATKIEKHLLVFNQIGGQLYGNEIAYNNFIKIIKSIADFCPNTYIALISRQQPLDRWDTNIVKLRTLDDPQIKVFIESHPDTEKHLLYPQNLAQIIEMTGGIPIRIEKLIGNLKYASFQDLVDAEKESAMESVDISTVPKSLQQIISLFSDSTNKSKIKGFKVLKTLTILKHGEVYNNLKNFSPGEMTQIENIAELEGLSLVEMVVKNGILSDVENSGSFEIKLFKVPNQIRDFINTMIAEQERLEILKNACTLYFGPKWREGSIKKIQSSALRSRHKFLNLDNCQLIVKGLLSEAISRGDNFEIERSAGLAVNYCEHIFSIYDYKNAASSSEEIYALLKNTDLLRLKSRIAKVLGSSLRMNNINERTVTVLREALGTYGNLYSSSDKNLILNELAYAYLKLDKPSDAIECAKQIEKSTSANDALGVTAKYIIAKSTLTGPALLSKLRTLERLANRLNSKVLANNISFDIAEGFSDQLEKERRYTTIVNNSENEYNIVRAVVGKALNTLKDGNGIVGKEDLEFLNFAYSYLYGQRLASLFQDCHHAVWLYCIKNQFYPELLNLFRFSSFVWRISAKEEIELFYFKQLEDNFAPEISKIGASTQNELSIKYYYRRKLEIEGRKI